MMTAFKFILNSVPTVDASAKHFILDTDSVTISNLLSSNFSTLRDDKKNAENYVHVSKATTVILSIEIFDLICVCVFFCIFLKLKLKP